MCFCTVKMIIQLAISIYLRAKYKLPTARNRDAAMTKTHHAVSAALSHSIQRATAN